jgi:hypothetical protein
MTIAKYRARKSAVTGDRRQSGLAPIAASMPNGRSAATRTAGGTTTANSTSKFCAMSRVVRSAVRTRTTGPASCKPARSHAP